MDCVVEILNDYLKWEKLKQQLGYDNLSREEQDDLRLRNDNDARYYFEVVGLEKNEALKADTIVSFWTPYKRLLKLEAGWTVCKKLECKYNIEKLLNQIQPTWSNDFTPKINELNKKIEDFAKVCYTKGNYMLLPERWMNNQRYNISEDRLDLTLYSCFDNGELAHFFKNEEELKAWIKRERLDIMFHDRILVKENIEWFVSDKFKKISKMTANEVWQYISNAKSFIDERNSEEL